MSKIYTLDNKLITEGPDIRIGDKLYKVDDRKKTVDKVMELSNSNERNSKVMDECLKLALGTKAFNEIEKMELSFTAYSRLFALAVAAMTGEEPETVEARFQSSDDNN